MKRNYEYLKSSNPNSICKEVNLEQIKNENKTLKSKIKKEKELKSKYFKENKILKNDFKFNEVKQHDCQFHSEYLSINRKDEKFLEFKNNFFK